ncbi:MAG TPA: hypothetical protein VF556_09595 [Pyrinomonadaceae bacterium]|jgi:hypothetical protein
MNVKNIKWRNVGISATAVFLFSGFLVVDSNAQTKKRSKTRRTVPIVQPVPVQTQGDLQVISRADEFPNENQVVVQPQNNQQTETQAVPRVERTVPNNGINDLSERVKNLEANQKKDSDDKQKRLMLNLDILTRAEQRAESLRKQLFEVIEKESQIKSKLDQIEYDIRPEIIERSVAFAGSLRPEELREARRKTLSSDKRNLENLLTEIQNTKSSLELNVQKADSLVDRLRAKLEKQIDDALEDDQPNQ